MKKFSEYFGKISVVIVIYLTSTPMLDIALSPTLFSLCWVHVSVGQFAHTRTYAQIITGNIAPSN